MIHLATTVCVYEHVCSEPYFASKFAYQFEIVNSCFVISNNICKMSSVEFRKHFQPLRCELYSHPGFLVFLFLVICQYYGINLAEIVHIFNIRFKMKYTPPATCQQLWQYHEWCICHHF